MEQNSVTINYGNLAKSVSISVVSALFAYLLIFLYTNYVTLYFAYDFDIPAYINQDGINLKIDTEGFQWSRDALITILLSRPISSITIGIIFIIILMIGTRKPVSVIFLLFWLNIFAFSTAFGVLIDDSIVHSGTYDVAKEMNLGVISLISVAILLAYVLYKVGMMNGNLIVMSFPNQNLFLLKNRIIFFASTFIFPWLLVTGYSYLSGRLSVPASEWLKNLPVLILLIPFLAADKIKNVDFKYQPPLVHTKTDLFLSILFVFLTIVLIFVLNNGISITHY